MRKPPSKKSPGCPVYWTDERIEKEAEELTKWIKVESNLFFKEFALLRGYDPNRFYDFKKKNEKFAEAFQYAKECQEMKIVKGALLKKMDSFFAKYILSNWHNWKEKSEISTSAVDPIKILLQEIDGTSKELVNE